MHSLGRHAAAVIGCFILTLVCVTPAALHGDEWNLTTRFTVNQPFEVPHMVLQPNTRYVIRILDSPSDRRIVQIYNNDQTRMLTTFLAVADERTQPTDNTMFSFIETEPGYPVPIKEWFYPGRIDGLEFVYPRSQAKEIALHAREPIQSATESDLHDLASINVEAVEPIRHEVAPAATAATITKPVTTIAEEEKSAVNQDNLAENEQEQPTQIAQNNIEQNNTESNTSSSKVQTDNSLDKSQESSSVTTASTNTNQDNTSTENKELPRTAGELPLIALIGVLCVGAGLGMRVLSSKS